MNIIMTTDCFYPVVGGRENVIDCSMRELVKNNNAILCSPIIEGAIKGKSDAELPYEVCRCKSWKFRTSEYLSLPDKKFKKEIECKPMDIIHCQTKYGMLSYSLKLGKKKHIPVVTTAHSNYPYLYPIALKNPLVRKIALNHVKNQINKCDACITVSYFMKSQLKKMGVKKDIYVIRNGVEFHISNLSILEQNNLVNKTYGLNENDFVFVYVGRLVKEKNIDFTLNCLKQLKEQNCDFKMLMVGDGTDRQYFETITKEYDLQDSIIYTGIITDRELLYAIYRRSNLALFFSLTDSDGLLTVEAAFNETPTMVLEETAPSERVTDGVNGFVVKNDANSTSNLLKEILNNKYDLAEYGKKAKQMIPENWETVTKKYLDVYKKVIDKYKKAGK